MPVLHGRMAAWHDHVRPVSFCREAKRQELLDRKRKAGAPIVVAVLPLSEVCVCTGLFVDSK